MPVKVVTLSFPILAVLKAVITKLEKDPVLGGMVVGSPEVYGWVLLTLKNFILRPTFQVHLHPSPWPPPGLGTSVLLWAVIEMKGFVVVLGGTGGGVFLYVVMQDDTGRQ